MTNLTNTLKSFLSRPDTSAEFEPELILLEQRAKNYNGAPPIVFYGSSSFRLWEALEREFSAYPVLNLGFGGSTLEQCAHQFQRIVLPAKPRTLVFYAGDNDIAEGASADDVLHSFDALLEQVMIFLPTVPTAYIAIKPSPSRWHLRDTIRSTNHKIADALVGCPSAQFLDIFPLMLTAEGNPRPDLFEPDMLHLNAAGYAIWAKIIRAAPGILSSEDTADGNSARIP